MQEENSKGLENLIKTIKSQSPLIPIEGIESMSKGFFAAPTAWFQSWLKPAIALIGGIFIIATALFIINKNSGKNDEIVNNTPSIIKDNSDVNIRDTLEVNMSPNIPPVQPANEPYKNNKKQDNTKETTNTPLKYLLTSADSAILSSLSAERQTFEVDPLRDTMITGKMGTKVAFYKACFEDMQGQVAKSNVSITLKECYNYPDIIKENLNTHWDSAYLESKGMIWLGASSEGKELKLREGFDCPVEFATNNVDDYNLYYSNTNKYSITNWELDELGKTPNPVIIPSSGRYWDISFNYFTDNYKFEKATMLALSERNGWYFHFTSTDTKMVGFTACRTSDFYDNLVCMKFRDLCNDIYKEVPEIKHSSWVTSFSFNCISRDSLNKFLANDTISRKVQKTVFNLNMKRPFFPSRLGWLNCDHPVFDAVKKTDNTSILISDNQGNGYTQTYLLLKKRKVVISAFETGGHTTFINLPRNVEATLFSYKLTDGKISYIQRDINTSENHIRLGAYQSLKDSDELVEKINKLTDPKVN